MSIVSMNDKFNKHTNQIQAKLEACIGLENFDLLNVCVRFTMEQIFGFKFFKFCLFPLLLDTMFDTEFHADDNDAIMIQEISEVACMRSLFLLYHPDWIFQWTSLHRRTKAWHEYLEDILKPIIMAKKRCGDVSVERDYKSTFIKELLKISYFEDIVPVTALMYNLKTIFLTRSEPLSIAISNVLIMLAMQPDVDGKVHQEIKELYQDSIPLDYTTNKKFTYLDRVTKETLRLITVDTYISNFLCIF